MFSSVLVLSLAACVQAASFSCASFAPIAAGNNYTSSGSARVFDNSTGSYLVVTGALLQLSGTATAKVVAHLHVQACTNGSAGGHYKKDNSITTNQIDNELWASPDASGNPAAQSVAWSGQGTLAGLQFGATVDQVKAVVIHDVINSTYSPKAVCCDLVADATTTVADTTASTVGATTMGDCTGIMKSNTDDLFKCYGITTVTGSTTTVTTVATVSTGTTDPKAPCPCYNTMIAGAKKLLAGNCGGAQATIDYFIGACGKVCDAAQCTGTTSAATTTGAGTGATTTAAATGDATTCSTLKSCTSCNGNSACVWCDSGARISNSTSTGSCSAGPNCTLSAVGTKPTPLASCPSSASSVVVSVAALVSALFAITMF